MKPLSHYLAASKSLSREAFVQRHPGPFLVHSSRSGGALHTSSGGRTLDEVVVGDAGGESGDGSAEAFTVFTTGQFAPRTGALAVGSDASSALRVAAASVSRVHALLIGGGSTWRVKDAGSLVGTWVNGEGVEATVQRGLSPGDRLSLGALDLTFLPAAEFYDFVRQTLR